MNQNNAVVTILTPDLEVNQNGQLASEWNFYELVPKDLVLPGAGENVTEGAVEYQVVKMQPTTLGIIHASRETEAPLLQVAELYFELGQRLELDWFSGQVLASKVDNEWQALARDTYLEDLEWQQRTLAVGALRYLDGTGNLDSCLEAWEQQQSVLLSRWQDMLTELHTTDSPDFAMFAVAVRELLDLAQSSLRT